MARQGRWTVESTAITDTERWMEIVTARSEPGARSPHAPTPCAMRPRAHALTRSPDHPSGGRKPYRWYRCAVLAASLLSRTLGQHAPANACWWLVHRTSWQAQRISINSCYGFRHFSASPTSVSPGAIAPGMSLLHACFTTMTTVVRPMSLCVRYFGSSFKCDQQRPLAVSCVALARGARAPSSPCARRDTRSTGASLSALRNQSRRRFRRRRPS